MRPSCGRCASGLPGRLGRAGVRNVLAPEKRRTRDTLSGWRDEGKMRRLSRLDAMTTRSGSTDVVTRAVPDPHGGPRLPPSTGPRVMLLGMESIPRDTLDPQRYLLPRRNEAPKSERKWTRAFGRGKKIGLAAGWSWRRPGGVVHRRAKSRFRTFAAVGNRPGLSCFQNGLAVISAAYQSTGAFISPFGAAP